MRLIPAILSHVTGESIDRGSDGSSDDALALAEAALAARHESPTDALTAASAIVARSDVSALARLVGLWAMGLAERELNRLAAAEEHLRAAIDLGTVLGDVVRVAQVRSALIPVLAARGMPDNALELVDLARVHLPDVELADLEMKRALVYYQSGRLTEALDAYGDALPLVVQGADRVLEARLRCNRAAVLAYRGDVVAALADAAIAERLAAEHGQFFLAGGAAHNHGFAAGRRGDVVAAIASFARADDWYGRVGHPGRSAGVLASDRCEVMLVAGLHDEARASAEVAVRTLEEVDDVNDLAEARLLLARACLIQGDHLRAQTEARAAGEQFRRAGRASWSTMADFVAFTAAQASPSDDRADLPAVGSIADDLERQGWPAEAASVRVTAAEIALGRGDRSFAREQLGIAARSRFHGRADRRASAWLATSYLRRADGDLSGAKRAAVAGLRVVTDHQATLGATDLRVGATTHADRLARFGLELAAQGGRPRDILTWAERVRANALAAPPVRPPDDFPLADALSELRRLRSELDETRRAGSPDESLDRAVRQQETRVRELARMVTGGVEARAGLSVAELTATLGHRRGLVEFVEVTGELLAVVVRGSGCRLHRLARSADVASLVDQAVFAASRLARTGASEASRAASLDALDDSLAQLDARLLRPSFVDVDELVVVPTGLLHNVPWGGLPSLRALPHTVATSATRWARRADAPDSRRGQATPRVVAITGPQLADDAAELAVVVASHPRARLLSGDAATVAAALELLGDADIAHVACHGNFRSDSPMFSSLSLADGPLTVYDVESIVTPPSLVVLPACNAGVAAVSVGDELIGTASALLGTGVERVVAPITVVNDVATTAVMAAFHRWLATGVSPHVALASVRSELQSAPPPERAAVSSFICLE